MRERWSGALALAVCAVLVLSTGCAALMRGQGRRDGKPRVVLLQVEGKRGAAVRNEIVSFLRDRYELVPRRQYRRAAKRLRARSLEPGDVAAVAAELDLAAVVHGRLERRGKRRFRLALFVRDGGSGEVAEKLDLPLRSRRLNRKLRRKLRRQLVARVGEVTGAGQDRGEGDVGRRKSRLDALAGGDERDGKERERAEAERKGNERAEAERKEQERARAEAEAEAERQEQERQRAEAARKEKERARAEAKAEEEELPEVELRRDDRGQVIDDEMPEVLR